MRTNSRLTLRQVYSLHYEPTKIPDVSKATRKNWRVAIRSFERFAGATTTVAQVTADTIARFEQWLYASGITPAVVKRYTTYIKALMSFAAPDRFKTRLIERMRIKEGAPHGTFEHHYWHVLRPALAMAKHPKTVQHFDAVVSRFGRFRKSWTELADLSEKLICQFAKWMIEHSKSRESAERYAVEMRQLVRRINPALCAPPRLAPSAFHGHGEPGTLRHFVETVYIPLKLLDAAPRTDLKHRMTVNALCTFEGRELAVTDLTDQLLARFMRSVLDTGVKQTTVNRHRSVIVSWWRLAYRRKLVPMLPDVDKLKEHRPEPDSWTPEEVGRILQSAQQAKGKVRGLPAVQFWRAWVLLIYYTALRRGTLLRLPMEALDWNTGRLEVPPELMKNRRGKKFILPQQAMDALRALRDPPRKMLFGMKTISYADRPLYNKWDTIIARAGLRTGPRHKFHKLRRTSATEAAAKGGVYVAMALLGHSEEYVTHRYIDPTKLPGHDIAAMLPPIPEIGKAG